MKYIFPLLLLFLASCGTVKKQPNIVPFDSHPRGLKVTDEEGKQLGVTPFFHEVDPAWSNHYRFIQGKRAYDFRYECQMNWGGSLVPGTILLPFVPVGTVLGSLFLLTDWISGGVYRCRQALSYQGRTLEGQKDQNKPARILPLPFKSLDRAFSERTHDVWQKKVIPTYFKEGDQIIWDEDIRDFLYIRGISHYKDNSDIHKIKKKYLYEIGHKFNATHFATFELYHEDKNYYTLRTHLWDAFSLKEVEFNKKPTLIQLSRKNEPKQFKQLLVETISLIPNSILFSWKENSEMGWVHEDNELIQSISYENHPNSLPKYLTFIGMETVQHPQFYDTWDYGFFLSPGFEANSRRSNFHLTTGETVTVDAATYHASYVASVKGFSPFGILSLGVGPSLTYLDFTQSNNQQYESVVIGLKFGVEYHLFFNDRYYFTLGTSHQGFEPKAGKHDPQYKLDGVTSTYVGIGYYFPSIRNMVRNLFN